jgi:hypothetical protein
LENILRKFIFMLLLPSALAFAASPAAAVTYKCVIKGVTTYSQEPCGTDAQKVDTTDALSGVGVPTPVSAGSPNRPAPPPPAPAPAATGGASSSDTTDSNSCAARMKAYQDSLACFAPYRRSATVTDPEAFTHCKSVPEPTDCLANGM